MSKGRLHTWIDEDILDKLIEEAEEMNVNKSEMLRIILARHYRSFSTLKDKYTRKAIYRGSERNTVNVNTVFTKTLYNRTNDYCNDHRVTRSSFVRRACLEKLKREGYLKRE